MFGVEPKHRHRGQQFSGKTRFILVPLLTDRLGPALVNAVAGWCRDYAVTRLILWSDTRFTHSHALYERLGVTRRGERTTPDVNQSSEYGYERAVGAADVIPNTSASSS